MKRAVFMLAGLVLLLLGAGRVQAAMHLQYEFYNDTLNPTYVDPLAALAIGASVPEANTGSTGSLESSAGSSFFRLTRNGSAGEVFAEFTLSINPGYSVTIDHIMLAVNAASLEGSSPRFVVSSTPSLQGISDLNFGITDNPGSVSQVDLFPNPPLQLNGGDIFTLIGQLAYRPDSTVLTHTTIDPGPYLQFSSVTFEGSIDTVGAVPEPCTLCLLGVGAVCLIGYTSGRKRNAT